MNIQITHNGNEFKFDIEVPAIEEENQALGLDWVNEFRTQLFRKFVTNSFSDEDPPKFLGFEQLNNVLLKIDNKIYTILGAECAPERPKEHEHLERLRS